MAGCVGSRRRIKATIKTDSSSVCPVSGTNSHNPQNSKTVVGYRLVPHTSLLINAIQWLHRPCGAPSLLDRLEKSPL